MKQREMSRWLMVVDVVSVVCCLLLAFVAAPQLGHSLVAQNPDMAHLFWPCLVFIWVGILPLLVVAYEAGLIFLAIGAGNSFCDANAKRLRTISYLGFVDVLIGLVGLIVLVVIGYLQTSVVLIVLLLVIGGLILAIVSAALSHLTSKATVLKNENDLTV